MAPLFALVKYSICDLDCTASEVSSGGRVCWKGKLPLTSRSLGLAASEFDSEALAVVISMFLALAAVYFDMAVQVRACVLGLRAPANL